MSYKIWFEKHSKKHQQIVKKLIDKNYSKDEIIEYFCYENMKKNEQDFCPLYTKDKKCHNIDELNCYLCACPNFRFSDDGIDKVDDKIRYSFCAIDSKDARVGIYGEKIHQDCSKCAIPHSKEYVKKVFDFSWEEIMRECKWELKQN